MENEYNLPAIAHNTKYGSASGKELRRHPTKKQKDLHGSLPDYLYKQTSLLVNFNVEDCLSLDQNDEFYILPGTFFREMLSADDKMNLINNLVIAMKSIDDIAKEDMIFRKLFHLFRIDTRLGIAVADALKIKISKILLAEKF